MGLSSECPCCAEPWSYKKYPTSWTHIKFDDATRKPVWAEDHGIALDDLIIDSSGDYLYISCQNSSGTAVYPPFTYTRKITTSGANVLWSLSGTSTTDTAPRTNRLCMSSSNDLLNPSISHLSSPFIPNLLRQNSQANGSLMWSIVTYVDTTTGTGIHTNDLCVDSDGNIYTAATGTSSVFDSDMVAYDKNGNILWNYVSATSQPNFNSIGIATNSSNICLVGQDGSTSTMTRNIQFFDMTGTGTGTGTAAAPSPIWTAVHKGILRRCAFMSNGNVVVIGDPAVIGTAWSIRCFDNTGTNVWNATLPSGNPNFPTFNTAYCITVDDDDNVYIGHDTLTLTGTGGNRSNCRKFDKNGNLLWVFDWGFGGTNIPSTKGIAVDNQGFVYVAGGRVVF